MHKEIIEKPQLGYNECATGQIHFLPTWLAFGQLFRENSVEAHKELKSLTRGQRGTEGLVVPMNVVLRLVKGCDSVIPWEHLPCNFGFRNID